MISTTINITRPNDSDVFFYDSQWFIDHQEEIIEFYNISVSEKKILDLTKTVSTDNLSSSRIIIFSSLIAKNEFTQQLGTIVAGSYDNFLKIRKDYCDSVGHTLEVIESN
jgi:hypothetical protein